MLKYTNLRKIDAYINKQFTNKNKLGKRVNRYHYSVKYQVLHTWRDYINDCLALEMDLSKENVLFPGNLYNAHQNTIKQVKVQGDAILDKKIKARMSSLEYFNFEFSGMFIRPAGSTKELIDEGKALNHCVGTYAKNYAEGKTDIFIIRKINEPNKPFFTAEIRKDLIVQVRGLKNCSPTKEISAFMDFFKEEKLTVKESKNRVKVAVPA